MSAQEVSAPVLSARVGENSSSFAELARLYVRPTDRVLDCTYGFGRFWKEVSPLPRLVRSDVLAVGDVVADYRSLPFAASSFDVAVLDPPYKFGTSAAMTEAHDGYGNNQRAERGVKAVNAMYEVAMAECWRVLVTGGVLIVKGMDGVESGRTNWFLHSPALLPSEDWEPLDLFVVVRKGRPAMRHQDRQFHARKNHSYFVVLRKRKLL